MNCDRSAQVHAYHDDALAPSARGELEAHLDACPGCRALLADLRSLSNLISAAPLAAMSPETMTRLSNSGRTARDRGVLRITSWLTAAAAAILIGALLLIPDRNAAPNPIVATSTTSTGEAAWETIAVMPPMEIDENVPELIVLAQWMANDLSPNDLSPDDFSMGERQ